MNSISRRFASGITERTALAVAGLRRSARGNAHASTFDRSTRSPWTLRQQLTFYSWELRARLRHALYGHHSMIPIEAWGKGAGHVEYIGQLCWLCSHREP